MTDFNKIALAALRNKKTPILTEGIKYPEGVSERMHPTLEKELKTQKHSLGKHPIFPEGGDIAFDEKIVVKRFKDVVNRYKRVFDVSEINPKKAMAELFTNIYETMQSETPHRKELVKLAVEMIRDEFDMDENVVEINAELTSKIDMEGTEMQPLPTNAEDVEFDSHEQIAEANAEVYKRRFINALIQGSAKKCNQMFHLIDDKILDIDPRLPNKYAKIMAAADYSYFIIPKLEKTIENGEGTESMNGGIVRVEFPSKENPKAVINVQAMVLPVLIHDLVKGVMELISGHGLPKNKKIAKYVINNADFLAAEPWDMRLGPGLWERFTEMLEVEDFHLKHHIYAALVALPVNEFNYQMKEIMAGTKKGKKIISELVDNVKEEFQAEEFSDAMGIETNEGDSDDDGGFDWDEIKKLL